MLSSYHGGIKIQFEKLLHYLLLFTNVKITQLNQYIF